MLKRTWIYETGEEVPEIQGSGSTYYSIYETTDFDKAMKESKLCGRNYLIRKKYETRQIREYWDIYKQKFVSY